ncbi:HPr kinase/phosphorylase [Rhizobium sp. SSA_523]|uniref:HPr kinase/phosphorylase n=1 Tax=Rhizobium sp. SSA_523 TaxID=2952477 RepID=UPI0020913290|nr:HPr kinase/phosphorylase [Rhizobium sp. SSA_523]MCO5734649.1 HPr kinase/phosphorylase [Rhizobium sp. SSA_523]WKC23420.1 HPr kinase/phosphorylase [Rhizobium sp. SSA_523]
MSEPRRNLHATAIVVGRRGLIFLGPSGAGKSSLAFSCLAEARAGGAFAALIADDQVFLSQSGDVTIAHRPAAIAGLMEIRGSGLVTLDSVDQAVLDLAILVVDASAAERLPPEGEREALGGQSDLPLIRLARHTYQPLAAIGALYPEFRGEMPFC